MSVIESALDPNSEEYRQNREALLAAVEEFRAIEQAVVDTLVIKCRRALEQEDLDTLVMAGGVSANQSLRRALAEKLGSKGVAVHYPPLALCTDNGAMIAYAGALRLLAGQRDAEDAEVRPRWPMTELEPPEAA